MQEYYKKGSVLDIFPIMIIIFITMLVVISSYLVWSRIDVSGIFVGDDNAISAMNQTERAILNFDNLIVLIFVILSIVVIVTASQIQNNPAWFFISLIILVIAFIVGVSFSNVYEKFTDNDYLSVYASSFPKTNFMFDKLPLYVLLMMFSVMVAMYAGYKLM